MAFQRQSDSDGCRRSARQAAGVAEVAVENSLFGVPEIKHSFQFAIRNELLPPTRHPQLFGGLGVISGVGSVFLAFVP